MKKIKYSFKDWCLDNNHQDWLDLWDYDLNECSPEEVTYKSGKKVYFKCLKGLHKSEIKTIDSIVSRNNFKCNQCNSFAQWCLDNDHQDWLNLWDYELNEKSPWDIAAQTNTKYYFKCQKGIHNSEEKYVSNLTTGKSSLFCIACQSIGQYIIDIYGKDMLHSVWSDKNIQSPFKVLAYGTTKCWFKCVNESHPDYLMSTLKYCIGQRCGVCSGRRVAVGINDIATTHPHLIEFFVNKDDATRHTCGSKEKVLLRCPICGYKKSMYVEKLVKRGFSCNCCGDGISYPNKFVLSVLRQLNIDCHPEYSPNWSNNKKYDIYCKKFNLIIENHGEQHYKGIPYFKTTLEEEQENDEYKRQLAINNGIDKYVVIDCRKSEMEFIKHSIMKSDLPKLLGFDENDVDWNLCAKIASNSLVKLTCNMWNIGMSIKDIADKLKIGQTTIYRYLHRGAEIGICDFLPKNKLKNNNINNY